MADNTKKTGNPDRSKVSKQPHEIDHLVKKHDLPAPLVKKIVEQVGPSRVEVDKKLEEMKKNGRK